MNECTAKSVFNYVLELQPDGEVSVKDDCGCPLKPSDSGPENIKRVLNTRTITITEYEGSQWIYIYPPGRWIQV